MMNFMPARPNQTQADQTHRSKNDNQGFGLLPHDMEAGKQQRMDGWFIQQTNINALEKTVEDNVYFDMDMKIRVIMFW